MTYTPFIGMALQLNATCSKERFGMVKRTNAILVFAATLVSAWLLVGPPIPPDDFDRWEAVGLGTRTITWEYRGVGMLAPLEMSHEQHLLYLRSGSKKTVPMGYGFQVNKGPMAITLALLVSIWTGVILACRQRPSGVSNPREITKS